MHHTYVQHGHIYQDQEYMHQDQKSRITDTCKHQGPRYIYASYTHGSVSMIIDICIIHTCIRGKGLRSQIYASYIHALINASYMHISGSRVMDKCIIGMCIMVTCIRINNICIAHAYNHEGQESYIYACIRVKDREKLINASYMHISGSWVMDKCIIGMCIMVTCIRMR